MSMLPPFKLEEFWKIYEFSAPYLLCPSDAETWRMDEIIAMADEETRGLWDNLSLGYTESPGLPLLRQEIAKLYSTLNADNILTTAGAEEGIYLAMKSLISPGDHVVVVTPTYQSLKTLAEAQGAELTSICVRPENQWKFSYEDIRKVWRSNTKLLILVCPHNPSGALIDKDVYEGIVELARSNGAYIFCDEVYRFLEVDESKRLPAIADLYEKGVSLNVMTKSFGLAGLRIGWLASKDKEFLNRCGSYKLYLSICNSAPSEILALIALRAKDKILGRNRSIVLENLKVLDEFVRRQSKAIRWIRPEGGTVAFLELLLPIETDVFMDRLVKEAGVLVMPSSVFDCTGNFFRIGIGRKNMPLILQRFEKFLDSMKGL